MYKNLLIIVILLFSSCSVLDVSKKREEYYVESDGALLPVVIAGTNSDQIILFVHGGPGSSGLLYYYADAWIQLRDKYRMVFYDQRGSGGGRGHISKESMTVDQHVTDLRRVVLSVKEKYPNSRIYLFGHSYGGMISAAFTAAHQHMISGLMMLSPALNVIDLSTRIPANMINTFINPYLARTDISQESRTEWENIKSFYQNNTPLQLDSFVQHNKYVSIADDIQGLGKFDVYFNRVFFQLLGDPLLEMIIWPIQIELVLPILDKNKESQRNLETDPKFNLANITVPSMLIVGNEDLVVPAASSQKAFKVVSSSVKIEHVYSPASHNGFIEQPQRIQQDIINFLRNN
ncbi:MAG: alpha/beta fold hydrolase [Brevinemataceae bacterium]